MAKVNEVYGASFHISLAAPTVTSFCGTWLEGVTQPQSPPGSSGVLEAGSTALQEGKSEMPHSPQAPVNSLHQQPLWDVSEHP